MPPAPQLSCPAPRAACRRLTRSTHAPVSAVATMSVFVAANTQFASSRL
jgi:hypothetical protein